MCLAAKVTPTPKVDRTARLDPSASSSTKNEPKRQPKSRRSRRRVDVSMKMLPPPRDGFACRRARSDREISASRIQPACPAPRDAAAIASSWRPSRSSNTPWSMNSAISGIGPTTNPSGASSARSCPTGKAAKHSGTGTSICWLSRGSQTRRRVVDAGKTRHMTGKRRKTAKLLKNGAPERMKFTKYTLLILMP